MPAQRRQRTTRRSSPAPLRPKSTNVPTPSKLVDRHGDDPTNLDTLTEEVTAVEQSVASPSHSVQNATAVSADTPSRERAPEHTHNGEDEPTKKGPINSPHNPFAPTSPNNSQSSKPTTLHEAIQSPAARTGNPFVDRALNHLRASRHVLWLGDSHTILRDCEWVTGIRSSSATLQWRNDASSELADAGNDAIIGFIGAVSSDSLNMGPDAGWQKSWGEEKLPKQKRSCRLVDPGRLFGIQPAWFQYQIDGASTLIDHGCQVFKEKEYEITHCLLNREAGYLRIRSPLFLPPTQTVQSDSEDDDDWTVSSEGIPPQFAFETWNMSSDDVQNAFNRVVELGHQPQLPEAYTRANKRIHPDNVNATLSGALVLAQCTLERMRYPKNNRRAITEFQYYANLVKVQVLKLAPSDRTGAAIKRKLVHSYGPDDDFESYGQSDAGGSPSKKLKPTLSTI
ncbi:hypothetical protein FRC09_007141 [Ceratobasidium sp. 395]|nr:hypothetical protein FRC09_007141 [Ceratobasidium sp. 395]